MTHISVAVIDSLAMYLSRGVQHFKDWISGIISNRLVVLNLFGWMQLWADINFSTSFMLWDRIKLSVLLIIFVFAGCSIPHQNLTYDIFRFCSLHSKSTHHFLLCTEYTADLHIHHIHITKESQCISSKNNFYMLINSP